MGNTSDKLSAAGQDLKSSWDTKLTRGAKTSAVAVSIVLAGFAVLIAVGAFPKWNEVQTKSESREQHKALREDFEQQIAKSEELAKSRESAVVTRIDALATSQAETKASIDRVYTLLLNMKANGK